jgi:hypothetical protein
MIPTARRRSTHARKISPGFLSRVLLAAVALVAVAIVALIVSVAGGRGGDAKRAEATGPGDRVEQANLREPGGDSRPIFKHSVIPGGVFTSEELQSALAQDAVAASHYKNLNTNVVRTETVKQDRLAYVSYRKDDQIYWTKNKVRVKEGETILTDGTNEVRARCGNCISETPRFPVADAEPEAAELDRLIDDPAVQQSPSLSAAIRDALESSLFGLLGAGQSGTPGNAASGSPGTRGFGSAGPGMPGGGGTAGSRAFGSGGSSGGGSAGGESLPDPVAALGRDVIVAGGGETSDPNPSSSSGDPTTDRSTDSPGESQGRNAPTGSPFVGGSTPGQSPSGTPGDPMVAGSPGVPPLIPPTGPAGVLPGAPHTEAPAVAGTEVPPGIDLPPGLNPGDTVRPLATPSASSPAGPNDEQGSQQGSQVEIASIPEPGSMFLLGGGAAVALLRRLRSTSRSR